MTRKLERLDEKLRAAHIARLDLDRARREGAPLAEIDKAHLAVQEAEAAYADELLGAAPVLPGEDLKAAASQLAALREESWYSARGAAVVRLEAAQERVDGGEPMRDADVKEYRAAKAALEVFDGPAQGGSELSAVDDVDWEGDDLNKPNDPTWPPHAPQWSEEVQWAKEPQWGTGEQERGWGR